VGIGVEETVVEHHLPDDARGARGEGVTIDAGRVERRQIGDLHAIDPLERDYPRGGQVPEDFRYLDGRHRREVDCEAVGVAALLQVVELRAQTAGT
jgi:hypothetical protein